MTRPVSVSIPHELGVAEARRRIEEGVDRLMSQSMAGLAHLDQRWDGNRMSFHARALGQGINGRMEVLEHEVRLEVDLPTVLAALAQTVVGKLRREGRLLLEKK